MNRSAGVEDVVVYPRKENALTALMERTPTRGIRLRRTTRHHYDPDFWNYLLGLICLMSLFSIVSATSDSTTVAGACGAGYVVFNSLWNSVPILYQKQYPEIRVHTEALFTANESLPQGVDVYTGEEWDTVDEIPKILAHAAGTHPWGKDDGLMDMICDSGATRCVTNDPNDAWPGSIETMDHPIKLTCAGKGQSITAYKTCEIRLLDDFGKTMIINDCLLIPEAGVKLLSVPKLDRNGCGVIFGKGDAHYQPVWVCNY